MTTICVHGIAHAAALDAIKGEYTREQATGEPRSSWLCECCMSPSGDAVRCPSCIAEVTE